MNRQSLTLPSFAKINWGLRILGRRPDGYHEVRTLLQTISLHDNLHFELTGERDISISCDDPGVPTDEQNLIFRAALALRTRYDGERGVRVRIEKRIPTQAGLGGGSSNAAVSLLALTQLWNLPAKAQDLTEIGKILGVDVPFFLHGGCALATGTGATVSAPPESAIPDAHHLIVITPNAGISTIDAYARLNSPALTTSYEKSILSSSLSGAQNEHLQPWPQADFLQNDFESVIFDIWPEIKRAKEILIQAGARGALLAGSGASVFGIFGDQDDQQRALGEIKLEAGWRIFPCVTVSRNEYLGALASLDIRFLRSFNFGSDIGA